MKVKISGIRDLPRTADNWKPDCIVSAVPVPEGMFDGNHLRVPIEDIYNAQLQSYKDAIRAVLAQDSERMLVHCQHGMSRSAALAIAKLYQHDKHAIAPFLEEHPEAEPNPLLLLLADEILGTGGGLLRRCSERYKGRRL